MLRANWEKRTLRFRFLARTSREAMRERDTYIVRLWDDVDPQRVGVGECNLFKGLSADDTPDYERLLTAACQSGLQELPACSSIIFGVEAARANLRCGRPWLYFPSPFTKGHDHIAINGLVWMGAKDEMLARMDEKLRKGFKCVKIKIGGISFDDEVDMLRVLRSRFGPGEVQLRLDANGAFTPANTLQRLERLAPFGIHSIEQPIMAGQPEAMARICHESPIPVALDEELIGMRSPEEKRQMLETIRPQFVVLKPALCGGFSGADEWIEAAEALGIGWWATSALESNVGLCAIAQWLAAKHPGALGFPQGLGTGQLYDNNFPSPLVLSGDRLSINPKSL